LFLEHLTQACACKLQQSRPGAVAALVTTLAAGRPRALPDAALDSVVLLHLERLAAWLAVYVLVLVILTRAWRGELPNELSSQGIKYAHSALEDTIGDSVEALAIAVAALEARVDRIEDAD
jgi:hypothetical protein